VNVKAPRHEQRIHLRVNGEQYVVDVPPERVLLDTLRENLGLTGTKEGCRIGVCGACTVLLNSKMVSSCLCLTVMADQGDIVTIEGLERDGEMDPVQEAFVERGGVQCGFCTPGQIMAARALLNEIPAPTPDQVVEWMTGNLCRCTGYYKILDAVLAAADTERRRRGHGDPGNRS
jgi:carbon-monoxide dehydrogenase small subunit